MKKYKVLFKNILYKAHFVEAENEDQAKEIALDTKKQNYEEKVVQTDPYWEVDEINELCPHCEIELEAKMVDIDRTNLEEHFICPDCGYGSPALR